MTYGDELRPLDAAKASAIIENKGVCLRFILGGGGMWEKVVLGGPSVIKPHAMEDGSGDKAVFVPLGRVDLVLAGEVEPDQRLDEHEQRSGGLHLAPPFCLRVFLAGCSTVSVLAKWRRTKSLTERPSASASFAIAPLRSVGNLIVSESIFFDS